MAKKRPDWQKTELKKTIRQRKIPDRKPNKFAKFSKELFGEAADKLKQRIVYWGTTDFSIKGTDEDKRCQIKILCEILRCLPKEKVQEKQAPMNVGNLNQFIAIVKENTELQRKIEAQKAPENAIDITPKENTASNGNNDT